MAVDRKEWVINGRFLAQPLTGVQRYGREIVAALDRLLTAGHPQTSALRLRLVRPRGAPAMPGLATVEQHEIGRLSGHLWEQIALPQQQRRRILNLCNTAPLMGRGIVCIHDTNVFDFPASYSWRFRLLYGALLPALARRSREVTTVSHYSAGRIAAFGRPLDRITVLPDGHEHVLDWRPAPSPSLEGLGPNAILVLGSRAPHKNLAMLIGMADRLAEDGFRLVIAGGLDAGVFQRTNGAAPAGVSLIGRVSDGELATLLGRVLCLAFPSFVEGFGLPALEAFAAGCPVVSSDRTSLPEVGGDAALYADPERPDQWLAAFRRLRDDPALRRELVERGRARVGQFSWQQSALGYLKLMHEFDRAGTTMG
jgi:glycosyltransferase involved in cell wall biosynthesis